MRTSVIVLAALAISLLCGWMIQRPITVTRSRTIGTVDVRWFFIAIAVWIVGMVSVSGAFALTSIIFGVPSAFVAGFVHPLIRKTRRSR